MMVFISWSGEVSHKVALVFKDWLPTIIQSIVPWVSSEDISKGLRWNPEIAKALEDAQYGLICVVPGNEEEPWLNFEAGAISKSLEIARVSPFLFGVTPSEISGPLRQFQCTEYSKDDVKKLLYSINEANTSNQIPKDRLSQTFELCWSELQSLLDPLLSETNRPKTETSGEAKSKLKEKMQYDALYKLKASIDSYLTELHSLKTSLQDLVREIKQLSNRRLSYEMHGSEDLYQIDDLDFSMNAIKNKYESYCNIRFPVFNECMDELKIENDSLINEFKKIESFWLEHAGSSFSPEFLNNSYNEDFIISDTICRINESIKLIENLCKDFTTKLDKDFKNGLTE